MKKIIILIVIVCTFCSCLQTSKGIMNLQRQFVDAEIIKLEDTPYFLIIDSVGVYMVSLNMPFSYDIYTSILIKKWNHENRN